MKKLKRFIIAGAAVSALLSLSACSSVNGSNTGATSNVNSGPPSLIPFPDTQNTVTDPTPIPRPAGSGDGTDRPPR
jgi:hypothetical protein